MTAHANDAKVIVLPVDEEIQPLELELPADVVVLPAEGKAAADEDGLPDRAIENKDGTVTLPLLFPVKIKFKRGDEQVAEDHYTQLLMHRLTGADMRAITAASKSSMIAVAFAKSLRKGELMAGALFDKLDGNDASAAAQIISYFLDGGRRTGG